MNKLPMILKINFMVLALIIVAFIIFKLNNYGLSPELQALFGLEQSSKGVATLEWCSPSLSKAEIVTGNKLEGTQGKLVTDLTVLNTWQAEFCKTKALWTGEPVTTNEMNQVLILSFGSDRPPIAIEFSDDLTRFVWAGRKFKSEDLKLTIENLTGL